MTDTTPQDQTSNDARHHRRPRRFRRAIFGLLIVGGAMFGGFAIGKASNAPWWLIAGAHQVDPDKMAARIDARVNKVLSRVDATPEQRGQVSAIMKAAVADVSALRSKPLEARGRLLELFRADTVNSQAVEAVRKDQIATADAATQRITKALTEAAAVLTPEQRRKLTQRWADRMSRI